ncbi:helix-turn-helix transcriptional regulator [Micromonospora sp. NPDC005413]|uniref:helix-turn-helix domain-containing protein n=1 Tax=Micromonospora sp. NPDC005413 TaxID=3154563 RepID=UPI0033B8374F
MDNRKHRLAEQRTTTAVEPSTTRRSAATVDNVDRDLTSQDQSAASATAFGAELRRRRLAAGMSLTDLGRLTYYSRGHLSKIENGFKRPGPDLARLLDAALDASGALSQTLPPTAQRHRAAPPPSGVDPWLLTLTPEGSFVFDARGPAGESQPDHRTLRWSVSSPAQARSAALSPVASYNAIFDHVRIIGQVAGPAEVLPVLVTATGTLRAMARHGSNPEVLALAARFAEYTGWMAQELGNDAAALWWTGQAAQLATAGGDDDLAAYGYVRRALIALYRRHPHDTVALARRARAKAKGPRVRGLAALREAQGHALTGDAPACRRALTEARTLLSEAERVGSSITPLGTTTVVDPVEMTRGWCLHDLGRPVEAARVLSTEIARLPPDAHRTRARYGIRLALVLASVRELEAACALLGPVLSQMVSIDSALIRKDLRHLARTLNRWNAEPCVQLIMPEVAEALAGDGFATSGYRG